MFDCRFEQLSREEQVSFAQKLIDSAITDFDFDFSTRNKFTYEPAFSLIMRYDGEDWRFIQRIYNADELVDFILVKIKGNAYFREGAKK
ncbi:MAG: hypothetical protein LBQ37_02600 [Elusimicrobiota bacterium]|jgi:hypothetical protein|nr:hypothetical protein [Elusimicrobiota bacterium]